MSWQDILKNVITQGKIKEIEDIDIDIDEDDCLRWLNRLHDIIDREPLNESKGDDSYRYLSDEEQACEIKKAWGNPFEKQTGDTGYSQHSYSVPSTLNLIVDDILLNKYFVTTKSEDFSKGAEVEFIVSNYDFDRYDNEEELFNISLMGYPTTEGQGIASKFVTRDKEKAIKIVKKLCNYLNLSYNEMARGLLL